jgi:hypothetical protein
MTNDARLIEAWLRLQEDWWAHDELDLLCESDPERGWSVVTELVERAPTREILEIAAAGPLEDLLRAHAPALIDRAESVAAQSARWREALAIVRVPDADQPATRRLLALGCQQVPNFDTIPAEFLTSVREFLKLLESDLVLHPREFLTTCARHLSLIYAHGFLLPTLEPETPDVEPSSPPCPPLNHRLGPWDLYFAVFDPLELSEPMTGSLADDLSDIYGDLAPALRAFEVGRYADAIWAWRFSLQGHAGTHLVSALRAIHQILQNEPSAT